MRLSKFKRILLCTALIFSCCAESEHGRDHNHANDYMHKSSIDDLAKTFDDENREQWQKPDEVIALLGDLDGKTVIDIGAGTGYFSFRLADKGAHVIAADVDSRFQKLIREKKAKAANGSNIELREVPYDSPNLSASEADYAIIVNTYHHINNRVDYLKKLYTGLKDSGKLMVVDYRKKEFEDQPHGPPLKMRLEQSQVIDEMRSAGFAKIDRNESLLKYQFIIIAEK